MKHTKEQPYYNAATKAEIDETRLELERFRKRQVQMAGAINSALDFIRATGIRIENAQISSEVANDPEALKEALRPHLNLVFTVAEAFEQRIAQSHQHSQQVMESSHEVTTETAVVAGAEYSKDGPEGTGIPGLVNLPIIGSLDNTDEAAQPVEPLPVASGQLTPPVEEPPVQEQAKESVPVHSDPAEPPITSGQRNYLAKLWGALGTPAGEQVFPATKREASDLINRLGEEKKSRETQPPAREPTQSQLETIRKIYEQLKVEEKDRKVPGDIDEANKLIKELMKQRRQSNGALKTQEEYPGRAM